MRSLIGRLTARGKERCICTGPHMALDDLVVAVTGGASGIGRASSLSLAARGARIVVADRNGAGAEAVAVQIREKSGSAVAIEVDVSASASVNRMVEQALSAFERIDVLVHCAGICPRDDVLEMDDAAWRSVLATNLDGTFYVARAVGRAMAARRSGTMILLTSDRGVYGSAEYAHYAASKGGMIALTKSLALALGKHGVTVNGVNPGFTDTPLARAALTEEDWSKRRQFDPLGSHSEPEEIAEIVGFLAGTAGKFMTGQIVTTRMRF